jgi:hypothetical protein
VLVVTGGGGYGGTGEEGGSSVPGEGGLGGGDQRGGFRSGLPRTGGGLSGNLNHQASPAAGLAISEHLQVCTPFLSPPISLLGLGLGFAS